MLLSLTLLFPLLLLALPLVMERVERPLRVDRSADALAPALLRAQPEELESLSAPGYAPAVERYWRRRRIGALRPERGGVRG